MLVSLLHREMKESAPQAFDTGKAHESNWESK